MESSHEANMLMELTGTKQKHMDRVLSVLRNHPGRAASELAPLAGFDAVETRRRLTDAKRKKLAYQSGKSRVSGRLEMLWWPNDAA